MLTIFGMGFIGFLIGWILADQRAEGQKDFYLVERMEEKDIVPDGMGAVFYDVIMEGYDKSGNLHFFARKID